MKTKVYRVLIANPTELTIVKQLLETIEMEYIVNEFKTFTGIPVWSIEVVRVVGYED